MIKVSCDMYSLQISGSFLYGTFKLAQFFQIRYSESSMKKTHSGHLTVNVNGNKAYEINAHTHDMATVMISFFSTRFGHGAFFPY